jgi:hypothetical protein
MGDNSIGYSLALAVAASGIRLEKSPVELRGELSTEWPQRVE